MRISDWSSDVCSSDLEDRGSQITFSGLGQDAPLEAKEGWDPDRAKRTALQKTLQAALPGLSINLGGTTSIDVTRAGVDKGYGLKRLSRSEEHTSELQSLMRISYAVFCLKKKTKKAPQN